MKKTTILVVSGGTGGHVFPAISLVRELRSRNKYRIIFATDNRGKRYIGNTNDCYDSLIVQNINTASRFRLYISLLINCLKSFSRLLFKRPKLVIGFGGYPSVPFVLASQLLGIKTIIHEQNAVLGKANTLLAHMATRIATGFSKTKGLVWQGKQSWVGTPTRFDGMDFPEKKIDPNCFNILVFGGSQGCKIFSDKVVGAICDVSKLSNKIRVFHQGRPEDLEKIKQAYEEQSENIEFEVKPFFENINEIYRKVDIVISRAGASSVFELTVLKKPSIIIPYEQSINGDQLENAMFLKEQDASIVIREQELSQVFLSTTLQYLITTPSRLHELSVNLRKIEVKNSSKKFANLIEETLYN